MKTITLESNYRRKVMSAIRMSLVLAAFTGLMLVGMSAEESASRSEQDRKAGERLVNSKPLL